MVGAAGATLLAAGASVFELDVQVAPHGVVVSHFLPLPWPLGRLERDNWRVRREFAHGQDVTLQTVVTAIPDGAHVLLDLKESDPEALHALALRLVAERGDRRWIVSTGSGAEADLLRGAGFTLWRSAGGRRALDQLLGEPVAADGVSVRHTLLDERTVTALRERVTDVVAWTVNSVTRAGYLLDIGVTGVTTDRSSVVEAVRRARTRP